MAYSTSRKAEQDILDIYLFTATNFGSHQADRYHEILSDAMSRLAHHPYAAEERHGTIPSVRVYPCKSHPIIYRVDEHDQVHVIRVRHVREDWQHYRHADRFLSE